MAPEVHALERGPSQTLFFRVDVASEKEFDPEAFDQQLLAITRGWQVGNPNVGEVKYLLIDQMLYIFPGMFVHSERRQTFGGDNLLSAGMIRFDLNVDGNEEEKARRTFYGHSQLLTHELPIYLSDLNQEGLGRLLSPHFAVEK